MIKVFINDIVVKILWLFKPVQMFLQRFGNVTNREPMMTKEKVDQILEKAKPGMGLLSVEMNRPTNVLVPGFWGHAFIVSRPCFIIEAVGDEIKDGKNKGGVRELPLEEALYKKDHVLLFQLKDVTKDQSDRAGNNSYIFEGLDYNYGFDLADMKKMFCSGLFYHCWKMVKPDFLKSFLKEKSTITPNDLYELAVDGKELQIIFDSRW